MFRITPIKSVYLFVFNLWMLHVAPSSLSANQENLSNHRISTNNNHLVGEHLSSLFSPPFSRTYTRTGLTSASAQSTRDQTGSSIFINETPKLPVWNGAPLDNDQRHIDLTQLFELMGEPRGSRGRELSQLITRPKPKCNRRIRILNGVTRIRERGSLARFQCSHGFTLIGPTTIVCLRDRWSEPPPICVKSGCRSIKRPLNAEIRQSIGGAVVAFYCLGETKLTGDPILFCDGTRWNGTEPICEAGSVVTTTPESEPEEVWPESGITPVWNITAENEEQDNSWDNNLQSFNSGTTDSQEMTTLSFHEETTETESSTNDEQTTSSSFYITIPTESHFADEQTTFDPVTEIISHTPFPDTKTEKQQEVPAPTTTEKSFILTHEMGHTETAPSVITVSTTTVTPVSILSNFSQAYQKYITVEPPKLPTQNVSTVAIIQFTVATTPISVPDLGRNTNASIVNTPIAVPPRRRPTKRPRRPLITRRPARRPFRRTTTTTVKPRKPKLATRPPPTLPPVQILTTSYTSKITLSPDSREQDQDNQPSVDYPVAIDKEFLPREQVEPVRPIIFPDMLNNNAYPGELNASHGGELGHASMIIGITLVVIGLATFSAGVVLYCWRKNKGIARARPYDMDGRTLSAHDANDDFMWMDQRDSGL